ncbi:hypothetical protein C8R42DRAFT_684781 [Lentinula raphanica]|nr:hypothetical protein C8R42DRAFT_684781 [Lentinula raphanica]
MVHHDVPHIHVQVPASPLVDTFQQASVNSDYSLSSNLAISENSNEDSNPVSTFTRLYSRHQASSSSLLSELTSSSSTASSSNLTHSTLSSSDSYQTSTYRIPPTAILALLELLDIFDADAETQVAHVKENIKETLALVDICRAERAEKTARAHRKKEANERGTLAVDSEFWCSV